MQKSRKEDITEVVSLYLKAREYIEDKEYEKAFRIFEKLANRGQSKGIKVEWTENLCGSVLGENGLGYMYAKGLYVTKNYNKAVSWFKKAADKHFSMAIFNLSIAYRNGDGVEQSHAEANRLNHQAALQGYGTAVEMETWETFWGVSSKVEAALNEGRCNELSVYNI